METLYTNPPEQRAVICLDQMGPVAAKSYPGPQLVGAKRAAEPPAPAPRATQEMDDGRRGKGDICGAFRPATGAALTQDYLGRTIHNWVGFLGHVEAWVPAEIERLDAIVDHLHGHRATDVLLFCLPHPRWEFVLQPKYAASLNLIEPWWKTLRSLALTGRRFATWAEVVKAIEGATVYGNNHRHPYIWGRRRRHRPRRKAGIAALPKAAETCRMHHLEGCVCRVSRIMVHHPSRVTEKERRHVCTIDEQRTVPMDKVGNIHGDIWSEVRNIYSRHIYLILTQPAFGSEAWVIQIFSLVEKKALLGLLTFTVMDFNRPLVMFRRTNKEEALQLHAQLRGIVTQEKEDDWCAFLPAPTPPEGHTEAAQSRRKK